MREVACRGLGPIETAADAHGLRYEDLIAGLPITVDRLRDPAEWVDWDVVVDLLERFERATSPAATIEMGRHAVDLEVIGPLRRIASLATHPRLIYQAGLRWQLPLLYRNITTRIEDLRGNVLRVEVSVPRHQRGSEPWMRYLQGGLEGLPTLCGSPLAVIDAEISGHRSVFRIQMPKSRWRPLATLRAMLETPALVELERQVGELRLMEIERTRVDEALRERERMLANLIANLSGMVYRCGRDAERFEFVSERCLELTGYAPGELLASSQSPPSLVLEADVERLRTIRRMGLESRHPISIEYRIRTRRGEVRWVLDVARGIYDADGRATGLEGFVTDVTERKQLEAELNHALRVEGIGRLAGGIAHDFNNLLGVILGSAELARRLLPEGQRAREHTEQVIAAAQRAAQLTRQLLAVARRQVIEPRVVDLNALVLGMDALLRRTLREDIELSCVLADGLWNVMVDPGQFEQVLLNLAINARDAMPNGGTLTVETANLVIEEPTPELPGLPPGLYTMLSVTDTGVGMDEGVRARAFEPFFTTKEGGGGTGLGLASSHGIVRQASGQIYLSSEPGRGSTFRICLPRATGAVEIDRNAPIPRAPRESHETVLVVEDHGVLRGIVVQTLEAQGYRVLSAGTGAEALAVAASTAGHIDLLLTDVVMPQMSGPELASRLALARPTTAVLFVSGYSDQYLLNADRGPTASSFLAKPFTPSVLADKVREVLDRASAEAAARGPALRLVTNHG